MKKKSIALLMAVVMLMGVAIGGTIAWLTSQTDPVTNTFTVGDINITLEETDSDDADEDATVNSYKMVPGNTITKDPKVTVKAGSEACWLFVKVEETENLDDYIAYSVDTAWTPLPGETGVYYREHAAVAEDATEIPLSVITGDTVTVKTTVTKTMMNSFDANKDGVISETEAENLPKLTFTAYAVQKDNVASAADAWAIANS